MTLNILYLDLRWNALTLTLTWRKWNARLNSKHAFASQGFRFYTASRVGCRTTCRVYVWRRVLLFVASLFFRITFWFPFSHCQCCTVLVWCWKVVVCSVVMLFLQLELLQATFDIRPPTRPLSQRNACCGLLLQYLTVLILRWCSTPMTALALSAFID